MLTLILLVLLGGGVALLAVTLAESKPARSGPGSRRGPEPSASDDDEPPAPIRPERPAPAVPDQPGAAGPPRVLSARGIPRSLTAVEGTFADVAAPSAARRLLSLTGIGAIVVLVGIAIALVVGAVVGGASEFLGNAIG